MTDYERIKTAIEFINENFQQQPDLDEVAKQVHVSPFYFQRMFTDWAGVSPKKILQYISLQHAKKLLLNNSNIADTSFDIGLSATSPAA
jgi:AraC family transcriptional regulator of adaptative response/methylated-DNA-[protein]-cysteine methyltransferase